MKNSFLLNSCSYSSDGFLEKNRDKLYGEGLELLSGSFRLFVRGLMSLLTGEGGDSSSPGGGSALEAAAAAPSGGGPRGRRASVAGTSDVTARPRGGSVGARRRGSVGSSAGGGGGEGKQVSTCTQFKDSLRDLVAQIGTLLLQLLLMWNYHGLVFLWLLSLSLFLGFLVSSWYSYSFSGPYVFGLTSTFHLRSPNIIHQQPLPVRIPPLF